MGPFAFCRTTRRRVADAIRVRASLSGRSRIEASATRRLSDGRALNVAATWISGPVSGPVSSVITRNRNAARSRRGVQRFGLLNLSSPTRPRGEPCRGWCGSARRGGAGGAGRRPEVGLDRRPQQPSAVGQGPAATMLPSTASMTGTITGARIASQDHARAVTGRLPSRRPDSVVQSSGSMREATHAGQP